MLSQRLLKHALAQSQRNGASSAYPTAKVRGHPKEKTPRGGGAGEFGCQGKQRELGYQSEGPFSAKALTRKSIKARTLGWVNRPGG